MYDNRYQPEEDDGIGILGPAAALTAVAAATPMGRRLMKKGVGKLPSRVNKAAANLRDEIMNPLGAAASKATGGATDVLGSVGNIRATKRALNQKIRDASDMPVWQKDFGQLKDEAADTFSNIKDTLLTAPAAIRSHRNGAPLWKTDAKPSTDEIVQQWGLLEGTDLAKALNPDVFKGARMMHLNDPRFASPQDAILEYMKKEEDIKKQMLNSLKNNSSNNVKTAKPVPAVTKPVAKPTAKPAGNQELKQFTRYNKARAKLPNKALPSKIVEEIRELLRSGETWADVKRAYNLENIG